jgi:Tfp pilus assembly protein PilX
MKPTDERGIALIISLLLVSIMSVLAASLMFLSQTETYASMNFRMTSQARYAAESGIQAAANFLLDTSQYLPPGTNPGDPLANYDRTKSPVTLVSNGNPVILSAMTSQASNYPLAAVQTAFSNAAKGTLAAGNQNLNYATYATLMTMEQFDSYGGQPIVVQTWQITSDGTLGGVRKATVEVSGFVERPKVSANSYALFAVANTCSAIDLEGNINVDSYDSSQGSPATTTTASGGNAGTNGNMYIQGSVSVEGNLSTPRTGVGTCSASSVDAMTGVGAATITGTINQLPAAVSYPPPLLSTTPPTTTVTIDSTLLANAATACSSLGLTSGTNCSVSGSTITIDGHGNILTMPSVVVASGITLDLKGSNPPNIIELNSLSGSGTVQIDANQTSPTQNQSVVMKVAGKNPDGTDMPIAFDLTAMAWKQNTLSSNYDASTFQIDYGGSQIIQMQGGNSQSAATIYAPNARFILQGTQDLYGSVLANTVYEHGNAGVHYDRRLLKDFYVPGHAMAGTFTWKSF